jgi:hypothetical protein
MAKDHETQEQITQLDWNVVIFIDCLCMLECGSTSQTGLKRAFGASALRQAIHLCELAFRSEDGHAVNRRPDTNPAGHGHVSAKLDPDCDYAMRNRRHSSSSLSHHLAH